MMKTKVKFLRLMFALIFSIMVLNACSISNSNNLELVNVSVSVKYTEGLGDYVSVVGTLKNNSKKNYTYCSITFNVYNESGTKIGQCLDNTNYLGSGETWQFKAQSFEWFNYSGTYTAKCVDITAF